MHTKMRSTILSLFFILITCSVYGQDKAASPFDFGRMWTFENPPVEWFQKAYNFTPDEEWLDDVRLSSLRFATWCSASFVSPDGLIMTNYHCSRDVAISVQKEGENIDDNGFYAPNKAEERRVANLFVEQLVMIADITDEVKAQTANAENDAQALELRTKALSEITEKYAGMEDWKGLRLQAVTYYSGGKFSLYGYKRYDDIRLVLIPENNLGLFGGDPDNFTYPRYNLDFTFWRAYDENGQPLNTSDHYFKLNTDGVEEGTPVFVVGNPGSTERYRTVAQLEYDRDHRYKYQLRWMTNRRDMMLEQYNNMKSDPAKAREAQELLGTINSLSNGIKAINGIVKGLHDDALFARKSQMEKQIRAASSNTEYWDNLATAYEELHAHSWAVTYLSPNPMFGKVLSLLHAVNQYKQLLTSGTVENPPTTSIMNLVKSMNKEEDAKMFRLLLKEIQTDIYAGDPTLNKLLSGKSIDDYVKELFEDSKLLQSEEAAAKCLSKEKNITKSKDPIVKAADLLIPKFAESAAKFQDSAPSRRALEAKIANEAFNVLGNSLPPDATFTLRISDGVVKSYDYNGTQAPLFTTYFGLYDRHYSHGQKEPWALPEKWQNPPMELLKSPLNFVSTNDIIGGNSGSAIVNQKGEAVGLIFDGNIESLPGNFIFDETSNRSISVHAGGIRAVLKYIYKADALLKELGTD